MENTPSPSAIQTGKIAALKAVGTIKSPGFLRPFFVLLILASAGFGIAIDGQQALPVAAVLYLIMLMIPVDRQSLARTPTLGPNGWSPTDSISKRKYLRVIFGFFLVVAFTALFVGSKVSQMQKAEKPLKSALESAIIVRRLVGELNTCEDQACIEDSNNLIDSEMYHWSSMFSPKSSPYSGSYVAMQTLLNNTGNMTLYYTGRVNLLSMWDTTMFTMIRESKGIKINSYTVANTSSHLAVSKYFQETYFEPTSQVSRLFRSRLDSAFYVEHFSVFEHSEYIDSWIDDIKRAAVVFLGPNALTIPTLLGQVTVDVYSRLKYIYVVHTLSGDLDGWTMPMAIVSYMSSGSIKFIPLIIKAWIQLYILPVTSISYNVIMLIATTTGIKSKYLGRIAAVSQAIADVSFVSRVLIQFLLKSTGIAIFVAVIAGLVFEIPTNNHFVQVDSKILSEVFTLQRLLQLSVLTAIALECALHRAIRNTLTLNDKFFAALRGSKSSYLNDCNLSVKRFERQRSIHGTVRTLFLMCSFAEGDWMHFAFQNGPLNWALWDEIMF